MAMVTLKELAARLARTPELLDANVTLAVKTSARKVRDTATKKFGHYQPEVGEFPAWKKLKPATIRRKAAAGGGEDPLIGHYKVKDRNRIWPAPLRTTVELKQDGWTAEVGTADPVGKYHEFGTETIPPRPFLRPALFEESDGIQKEIAGAVLATVREM